MAHRGSLCDGDLVGRLWVRLDGGVHCSVRIIVGLDGKSSPISLALLPVSILHFADTFDREDKLDDYLNAVLRADNAEVLFFFCGYLLVRLVLLS